MTEVVAMEAEIRKDAYELIRLEDAARKAFRAGNVQDASEIWARRDIVRHQRSYLMRMLWAQQGVSR